MIPFRVVRDAVHGDIDLTELEGQIVDTPQFQRLRRVRQLGSSFLVFPSANHTRFEHSLGTVAVAQRMIDHLNRQGADGKRVVDDHAEAIVRLASLVHDVEHIPFGHTLEDDAGLFTRHDSRPRLTQALGTDSDIGQLLESSTVGYRKEVLELLFHVSDHTHPKPGLGLVQPWMVDLVGNTICADLLDYVRRDLYFCGITDDYDDRVFRSFEIDSGTQRLVIRLVKRGRYKRDIQSELLGILGIRYSLSEKVLYHHTKLALDAMLSKGVEATRMTLDELKEIDDLEVIRRLARSKNPVASKVGTLLERRGKYKPVFEITHDAAAQFFPPGQTKSKLEELAEKYSESNDAAKNRLRDETGLERTSGLDDGDVIIFCLRKATNLKEAQVMVLWGGKATRLMDVKQNPPKGEVEALDAKYVALWKFGVFVHPEKYELFAVELERNVRKLVKAENVLRMADPDEWGRLDQYQEAFESFAREKNIGRIQEVDEFRKFALAEGVKARAPGKSSVDVFRESLSTIYNAWSQEQGK